MKVIYPDEPWLTVAKGMKLLASALLKSTAKDDEVNTVLDSDNFTKTTMYLTLKQRSEIEKKLNDMVGLYQENADIVFK